MRDNYQVLVLSDLHAVIDAATSRTPALNYADKTAARALFQLCLAAVGERFPEGIDLVLVAGDMTNQASTGSLSYVWSDLNWLASELGAPLVATAGNHDYDSRANENLLPYESLMELEPPFPFGDKVSRDKYFAQQHAVFASRDVVVVTANSAAHHGYTLEGEPEHRHGRYSPTLPRRIRDSLDTLDTLPPVRIFLTHHHMSQLPDFDYEETSYSVGYDGVLSTLGEFGDWLIVHGHKHRGWIQYANGNGDAPPLFSSSSFSADFGDGTFAEKVRHQFHVIQIPLQESAVYGITGAHGTVTSWIHSRLGWAVADSEGDLPGSSGFGWKASISDVAERLRGEVVKNLFLDEVAIHDFEPKLKFLTFVDQRRLVRRLASGSPAVRTILMSDGSLRELSLLEGPKS